jgi:asparagine synthase (glutamine-hydrolysing)
LRRGDRQRQAAEDTIINQDFAERVGLMERLEALRSHSPTGMSPSLRENQANVLDHPYIVVALERYDRVASAHSIEPRHPFLDRRLVEFCLALPWHQKVHRGWTKVVLRRAMGGILPDEVRWRDDKENLSGEFATLGISMVQSVVERAIRDHLEEAAEYVDMAAVRAAYDRWQSEDDDLEALPKVWEAVNLVWWLRERRHPVRNTC